MGPISSRDLAVLRSLALRGNKSANLVVRVFDTLRASDTEMVICRAATLANRALTGLTNDQLDGITPLNDELFLVKEQSDNTENGVYLAHAGAWTRLLDDKGDVMIRAGMLCQVTEGSTLADTQWSMTEDGTIVIGTDAILWEQTAGDGAIDTAELADGAVTAIKLATDAVTNDKIGNLAVDTAEIAASAVETTQINNGAVTVFKLGTGALAPEDLGAPDLLTDNRFLLSVVMQATAYTLDNTSLPADNPPRNVILTHTTDTSTDTLGDAVIDGTDFENNVIQETIAVAADGIATGVKAFKTVTAVTTAGWVQVGGVSDLLEVGFGHLLGLSRILTNADQVFMATLAGLARLPDSITVNALIEQNTISLDGGTYDSTKEARAIIKL